MSIAFIPEVHHERQEDRFIYDLDVPGEQILKGSPARFKLMVRRFPIGFDQCLCTSLGKRKLYAILRNEMRSMERSACVSDRPEDPPRAGKH